MHIRSSAWFVPAVFALWLPSPSAVAVALGPTGRQSERTVPAMDPAAIIRASTDRLGAHPTDTKALAARAAAYTALDNFAAAVADYTTILAITPADPTALSGRAFSYAKQGKWDQAAADYRAYVARKPDDLDALRNLGVALYNAAVVTGDKAKLAESERVLAAYDAKRPGDKDVASITHDRLHRTDLPAVRYEKAVAADPTNPTLWFNLGVARMNAKQYAQAAEAFGRVIALIPGDREARQNRAAAYFNQGQKGDKGSPNTAAAYEKGITDATWLIERNPRDADALLLRADIRFSAKRFSAAAADYLAYLNIRPGDDYASKQVVASCIIDIDGNVPALIEATTNAIAARPNDPANYNYRALAYLRTRNYDKAIADLLKYTDMKPDDATGLFNLGVAYVGKGDTLRAARAFEKAVAVKPDYAEAAMQAAQAYKRLGDADKSEPAKANSSYDKAIDLYDKVTGTAKRVADATYNKAVALEAKAQANADDGAMFRRAIMTWEKYIALAPTDPELPKIKQHLATLKEKHGD